MKKALSLVLAIVFMFALAIPAFAGTITSGGPAQGVTATYTVAQAYTVTIPSEINANTGASVTVGNVVIENGKKVSVTVASTNDYNFKYVVDEEELDSIAYTLKVGGSAIAAGKVIEVNAATTELATATLTFEVTGSPKYQAAYTDTLTFSATVIPQ